MAKTGRPRLYGDDWVGLSIKIPPQVSIDLTKICISRGVSINALVVEAIGAYVNHDNPYQDKGDSLKSAKVDLNQLKFHPVAFAAGQYPTTPIHAEVLRSHPEPSWPRSAAFVAGLDQDGLVAAQDRLAVIMARVPGLQPLSQISAEESAELDQAGIPPMPVDWDDAPDEPRISWLADIEKVKADIEADNAAAGHEHWDCVTNDRCVSTKDARWTVLPNKAAVLQRARDLDAKYPIVAK